MDTRPASALGLVAGGAVGAGAVRLAGDVTLALAVSAVYAVAVGVAARWEPVARERGIWGGMEGRQGSLVGGGVVALALLAAVVGVHPALETGPETTLVLRLLVLGCVFAGLYLGVAAVLMGIDPEETGADADAPSDEGENDATPDADATPDGDGAT